MSEERNHPPTFLVSLVLLVPVAALVVIWMTPVVSGLWLRFVLTLALFPLAWWLIGLVEHVWQGRRRFDDDL